MSGVDKAKNKAEELAGKAKEKLGHATGDADRENEGRKDRATGNLKQAGEKAKDAFRD
ncbi:MAG: CsbD family protein [Mycobacteriaceae bacterium]|nr:CsbD family protein [Mycobacteriaceae bacterium]